MPRIPSAADVSSIGASSARLPTVRASAEDFGLNAAEGLRDFATGIDAAGKFLDDLVKAGKKREEAQQSVDAGQHVAETREESNQLLDRWDYGGSSPQEAAAQSSKELEAWEDARLQQMPSAQRAVLKAATASIRQGHGLRLAQRAQNAAVAAMSRQTDETLRLVQEQAVREPEAAAHYAAEGQAQLQSLLDAGALTTEQFAKQEQTFRRELFAKVVRGQPAVLALADLEDGIYDAGLGDPALKRALTEETAWRLQSETAQGTAAAEAQLARARRGEAAAGGLSASSQAIFAAGEMGDAELQAEIAFRVNSEMQRLRYAPVAEISGRPEDLAPAVGTPDAETRQRIRQEVWTQSQAMLRERRRDPAAYVIGQPAVAKAFAAAAKSPALLPDAVAARLAAQAAMGLTSEEQNALTLEERERFVAGLRQLPPEQRFAAVMELGRLYGDQAASVAAELAEAGLAVEMQLAADPSAGAEVSGRLARVAESRSETRNPEGDVVQEAAKRLLEEWRRTDDSRASRPEEQLEDMEFSLPSSRPKPNPLREDESVEGRLHIPKLAGTPREQVQILMDRMGVSGDAPRGPIVGRTLEVLKDIAQIRSIIRDEGLAGRDRVLEAVSSMMEEGEGKGIRDTYGLDVVLLGKEVLAAPYKHPWSLTDRELTSVIGVLSERLRDSADQSVGWEVLSLFVELFPMAQKLRAGAGFALSTIGLSDSIDTATAQEVFWRLVNEAAYRKIITIDPRAAKSAGVAGLEEFPTGVGDSRPGGGSY